ncbi:MAG: hypothetical protein PHO81_03895 [Candidatus Omnitrophica bacterium]|nr:hypothetical protein [Candidatus Omnitrophota bacterium]
MRVEINALQASGAAEVLELDLEKESYNINLLNTSALYLRNIESLWNEFILGNDLTDNLDLHVGLGCIMNAEINVDTEGRKGSLLEGLKDLADAGRPLTAVELMMARGNNIRTKKPFHISVFNKELYWLTKIGLVKSTRNGQTGKQDYYLTEVIGRAPPEARKVIIDKLSGIIPELNLSSLYRVLPERIELIKDRVKQVLRAQVIKDEGILAMMEHIQELANPYIFQRPAREIKEKELMQQYLPRITSSSSDSEFVSQFVMAVELLLEDENIQDCEDLILFIQDLVSRKSAGGGTSEQEWEDDYYKLAGSLLRGKARELFDKVDSFYLSLDIALQREKIRQIALKINNAPFVYEVYGLGFPFYGDLDIRKRIYSTLKDLAAGKFNEEGFMIRIIPDIDILIVNRPSDQGPWSVSNSIDAFVMENFISEVNLYQARWQAIFRDISNEYNLTGGRIGSAELDFCREFLESGRLNVDIVPVPTHIWKNIIVFVMPEDLRVFRFIRDLLFTTDLLSKVETNLPENIPLQFRKNFLLNLLQSSPSTKDELLGRLIEIHPHNKLIILYTEIQHMLYAKFGESIDCLLKEGLISERAEGKLWLTEKGVNSLKLILDAREKIMKEGFDIDGYSDIAAYSNKPFSPWKAQSPLTQSKPADNPQEPASLSITPASSDITFSQRSSAKDDKGIQSSLPAKKTNIRLGKPQGNIIKVFQPSLFDTLLRIGLWDGEAMVGEFVLRRENLKAKKIWIEDFETTEELREKKGLYYYLGALKIARYFSVRGITVEKIKKIAPESEAKENNSYILPGQLTLDSITSSPFDNKASSGDNDEDFYSEIQKYWKESIAALRRQANPLKMGKNTTTIPRKGSCGKNRGFGIEVRIDCRQIKDYKEISWNAAGNDLLLTNIAGEDLIINVLGRGIKFEDLDTVWVGDTEYALMPSGDIPGKMTLRKVNGVSGDGVPSFDESETYILDKNRQGKTIVDLLKLVKNDEVVKFFGTGFGPGTPRIDQGHDDNGWGDNLEVEAPGDWDRKMTLLAGRFKPVFIKEAIENALTADNGKFMREVFAGMRIDSRQVDSLKVSFAQEGPSYGVFRAGVKLKDGSVRYFGLNIALNNSLNQELEQDYRNLNTLYALQDKNKLNLVPRPYAIGKGTFAAGNEAVGISLFAVEWLDGYIELHRDGYFNESKLCLLNNYLDTRLPASYESLDKEEAVCLRKKIIFMMTLIFASGYDEIKGGLFIERLSLNNGDFMAKRAEGSFDLRLITARGLSRIRVKEFLNRLLEYENIEFVEKSVKDGSIINREVKFRLYEDISEVKEGVTEALIVLHGESKGRDLSSKWFSEVPGLDSSKAMTHKGALFCGAVALLVYAMLETMGFVFALPGISFVSRLVLETACVFLVISGITKAWEIVLRKICQIRAGPAGRIAELDESSGRIRFYALEATTKMIRNTDSLFKKVPLLAVRFLLKNAFYPFIFIHEGLHKYVALFRNNEGLTYFAQGSIILALAFFTQITYLPFAGVDMIDVMELILLLFCGQRLNSAENAKDEEIPFRQPFLKDKPRQVHLTIPKIEVRPVKLRKVTIKARKVVIKIRRFQNKKTRKPNIKTRTIKIINRGKIKQTFFRLAVNLFKGAGFMLYRACAKAMGSEKISDETGITAGGMVHNIDQKVQKIEQKNQQDQLAESEVSGDG